MTGCASQSNYAGDFSIPRELRGDDIVSARLGAGAQDAEKHDDGNQTLHSDESLSCQSREVKKAFGQNSSPEGRGWCEAPGEGYKIIYGTPHPARWRGPPSPVGRGFRPKVVSCKRTKRGG